MCGIVGVAAQPPVNQLIYDSLLLLQHRGQDAAGIATSHEQFFNMYKAHGLVRDVFRTRNMRALPGSNGLGQVRYPTAGSRDSVDEAQPRSEARRGGKEGVSTCRTRWWPDH